MTEDLTKYLVLGEYKGLTVEIPKAPVVTDDEVMQAINDSFMAARICKKITDRAVTKEDTVSISYKGFMGDEQFEGGTGEKDHFTIYDGGGFIPGFAEGLVGATPGEEIAVELTFPENYYEELAGNEVTFYVTVHHIYEADDLTDENAVKLTGKKEMTVEGLIAECRQMLEEDAAEQYKTEKGDRVFNEIVKAATVINAPKELVDKYYNADVEYYKYYAEAYGMTYEEMLEYVGMTDGSLRERAEANVMKDIAIYSVIKAENITITDEEFERRLAILAESMGGEKEDVLKFYEKEELVDKFTYSKAYETAVDWQDLVVVGE